MNKVWSIEVRPIISQQVEADTWEEAKEKIRKTFEEQPWELEDIDDCEIYDVTPPDPNAREQKLLARLGKLIEEVEAWKTPDSTDVENVNFGDDDDYIEEEDPEDDWMPRYVYADICVYDGCGGQTIEKNVEYSVEELLGYEAKKKLKEAK